MPGQGVRVAFIAIGDGEIELIQPVVPESGVVVELYDARSEP